MKIVGIKVPRDSVNINYAENAYLDHYRDLKAFYREYVGAELISPFKTWADMKTFYPIQVIDLGFQVDHINIEKIRLFEYFGFDSASARLFAILIRHREIKMTSDGKRITETQDI